MILIDTGQIAALLHVSRKHVTDNLTKRTDFPKPVVNLSQKVRRWDCNAVMRYVMGNDRACQGMPNAGSLDG